MAALMPVPGRPARVINFAARAAELRQSIDQATARAGLKGDAYSHLMDTLGETIVFMGDVADTVQEANAAASDTVDRRLTPVLAELRAATAAAQQAAKPPLLAQQLDVPRETLDVQNARLLIDRVSKAGAAAMDRRADALTKAVTARTWVTAGAIMLSFMSAAAAAAWFARGWFEPPTSVTGCVLVPQPQSGIAYNCTFWIKPPVAAPR